MEGYTISAGAGSQSVMEASRRALADFVEEITEGSHLFSLAKLYETFSRLLRNNYAESNDRVMVPSLEVFAFLLHSSFADLVVAGDFE